MASRQVVVFEMKQEFGKDTPAALALIDQRVGDVTVDLLSQNEGRFRGLSMSATLTFSSGETSQKLPGDFNAIKETFSQVDSEGKFIAECMVLAKSAVHRRLVENRYAGFRLAYINRNVDPTGVPGHYLVLAAPPDEETYYEVDYYRIPTGNDTDIITNVDIVKEGVRSKSPDFVGAQMATYHNEVYLRMRQGFREEPEKVVTNIVTEPPRRVARHNQRMHRIGGGS